MLVDRRQLLTNVGMGFMTARISPVINAIVALFILMCLTMGCQSREFTLTVSGEDDAEGGDVFVNGKWVGTMAKEGEQGPQFSMTFPNGTLTVEVKKDGYLPFLAVITVASQINEQRVHVQLARDTISEERDKQARRPISLSSPPFLPMANFQSALISINVVGMDRYVRFCLTSQSVRPITSLRKVKRVATHRDPVQLKSSYLCT